MLVAMLTTAATVGIGAITAAPALATGCFGSSCTAQDPEAQGCDAQTWDHAEAPGGGGPVELRVSTYQVSPNDCDAAWARAPEGFSILIQGSTTPDDTHIVAQYGEVDGSGSVEWTDMVDFSLWTRACIKGVDSPDWNCTDWH